MFELDSRLAADTYVVGELPLSRVLLMNDRQFPWIILVPKRAGVQDTIDLTEADQLQLLAESRQVCLALKSLYAPDKLNVAALGNIVKQLHVHHIARYRDDIAWPQPIWGRQPAIPYDSQSAQLRCQQLKTFLNMEDKR
ncbi:HIT domain-containing protein [Alteromonas pelagimontana]|uniref:HIT domain-containing protein n=1 Tax=Alteromonas pelagimontana TaxID=1858656 RepID=A0A6M4M938_9ALTE|nr:HIT family protein [Alteromonas pelagimontana]QJR79673.1 HIT domain-containing protein [Alteromonas pelagimontana]